jgi:hypothetical protein
MPDRTFSTERTQRLRRQGIDEREESIVADIEAFGCSIIHVMPSECGPGWSYTIGIHDTCGAAEVIVVGLPQETAHFLLNEAADRQRSGIDLDNGRHREMVGEVDCEFRSVDPNWVEHLLGWANWYYGDHRYPVLQAVYPDLENRFPEDAGFDVAFVQPLLQSGRPLTALEKTFWASADPSSSLSNWRFTDPPHTRVFLSAAVYSGLEAVTYVSHDSEDGAWQFLGDTMSGGDLPLVSCFHHPIDRDRSLEELADLPLGWWAERVAPGHPWTRHTHETES